MWGATNGGADVLTGARATETAFKRSAPGKSYLHLATHGFFLGNDCDDAVYTGRGPDGLRGIGGRTGAKRRRILPDNPLLLSGLALAGANQRRPTRADPEDGILTAEEVAALDLDGVEWAVLSACDTGVGGIKAGEGVFGLRRAFRVAGARTIIMSLWAVEDRAAEPGCGGSMKADCGITCRLPKPSGTPARRCSRTPGQGPQHPPFLLGRLRRRR